jgi:hypothetical protein
MKKIVIALAILIVAPAANARDANKPCFKVDDQNNPAVTVSGRLSTQHQRVPKESELQAAKGFSIKLDGPLRADARGGCADWNEIAVMEMNSNQLARLNNRHVTIEGKRFGSALVYPPIHIQVTTIKGD